MHLLGMSGASNLCIILIGVNFGVYRNPNVRDKQIGTPMRRIQSLFGYAAAQPTMPRHKADIQKICLCSNACAIDSESAVLGNLPNVSLIRVVGWGQGWVYQNHTF